MKRAAFFATVVFPKLSCQETAIMRAAFLMLAIVTFCCCKKKVDDKGDIKDNLISKWELRESIGGWTGHVTYPPGNGTVIEFKSDNSFAQYRKDTVIRSGTYGVEAVSEKDKYKITYNEPDYIYSVEVILKGDTLTYPGNLSIDMPSTKYVKIN